MFTGIISSIGNITQADVTGDLRLVVSCPWNDLRAGESVACNGACLTVTECSSGWFTVQLSAETVARTAPRWQVGDSLNLERALKLGDTLDGHIVTGHVDDVATILSITPNGESYALELEAPATLARFIAEKGSVTLDGISLTVNRAQGARFMVMIIPHSWRHTTLCQRKPGDRLNLEIDILARYVARLHEAA
jgi:riboflavin synthase